MVLGVMERSAVTNSLLFTNSLLLSGGIAFILLILDDLEYDLSLKEYGAFGGIGTKKYETSHVWLEDDKNKIIAQRGNGKANQSDNEELAKIKVTGVQMNKIKYFQYYSKYSDLFYLPFLNDCHTRIKDAQKFAEIDQEKQLKTPRLKEKKEELI